MAIVMAVVDTMGVGNSMAMVEDSMAMVVADSKVDGSMALDSIKADIAAMVTAITKMVVVMSFMV